MSPPSSPPRPPELSDGARLSYEHAGAYVPPAALHYAARFSPKPASSSVRLKNEGPHSITLCDTSPASVTKRGAALPRNRWQKERKSPSKGAGRKKQKRARSGPSLIPLLSMRRNRFRRSDIAPEPLDQWLDTGTTDPMCQSIIQIGLYHYIYHLRG